MDYAIIVAAGSGTRMKSEIPKQFLLLREKHILVYSIEQFLAFNPELNVILVLPKDFDSQNYPSLNPMLLNNRVQTVCGGETRFHSVKNGLDLIIEDGIVFIHDAVRPFITQELLARCFLLATEKGNAIPVIDLKDSIRMLSEKDSKALNRSLAKSVQTPQTFQTQIIKEAFNLPFSDLFTDEASVLEANNVKINLVEGDELNLKITSPLDLTIAENILANSIH